MHSLLIYKSIILLSLYIDLCLFYYLVLLITKNNRVSLFCSVVTILLFQLRVGSVDPILSFNCLLELVLLFAFLSLIFLLKYLQSNDKKFIFFSAIFYVLDLLTYEVLFPLFLLHVFTIFYFRKNETKRNIKTALVFISIAIIYFGICLWLRSHASDLKDSPYQLNFKLSAFKSYFLQLYAALPLSFYSGVHRYFKIFNVSFYLLFTATSVLFFLLINKFRCDREKFKPVLYLVIAGVFFWIIPAVLISLSPKYQHWISFGFGYLPVYVQYYGVAIIIGFVMYLLARRNYKRRAIGVTLRVFFAILLGFVASVTYLVNYRGVEKNCSKYPRVVFWRAVHDLLKNKSVIILDNSERMKYPFTIDFVPNRRSKKPLKIVNAVYSLYSGKKQKVVFIGKLSNLFNKKYEKLISKYNVYIQQTQIDRYGDIYSNSAFNIMFDKISRIDIRRHKIFVSKVKAYVDCRHKSKGVCPFIIVAKDVNGMTSSIHDSNAEHSSAITYFPAYPVKMSSIRIIRRPKLLYVWRDGFFSLEQGGVHTWHWCGKEGQLVIYNSFSENKKVTIKAKFKTGYSHDSDLKLAGAVNENLKINKAGYNFKRTIIVKPGENVINFSCNAKRLYAPNDPRYIVFGVFDFHYLILPSE